MKPLTRRRPKDTARASSWARIPREDGGCVWRLFRRIEPGKPWHCTEITFPARMCRKAVADKLRAARAELLDRVILTLMEAA